jgi:histidinol dehydrogenase
MQNADVQAMEAKSKAIVAAGEGGVSGLSVEALIANISRKEATYAFSERKQAEMVNTSRTLGLQSAGAGYQRNLFAINKPIPQPDYIGSALSGIQSAIALVDDINQGLEVVNAYAAEHLEIHTRNARVDSAKVRNAGAVFIGSFTPVSLGDYSAGSNHVLPTGGCACHSSGLSVATFLRGLHFIEYDEKAFRDIAQTVITLAEAEDLPAHGQAMSVRLDQP